MKVNDDLRMLPVALEFPGRTMVMNLSLILDQERGASLVDASMPGTEALIEHALEDEGFSVHDIRQILVTHQDVDHIGALSAIQSASGANVYAHAIEAPYIEGKTKLAKYPSPERFAENPGVKAMFDNLRFTKVDKTVEDGDVLDFAGGVRVIFTPGHAPGHVCYYLERSKVLVAGDALTSENGRLKGPNPGATPDMPLAIESCRKLAELPEINAIVTYHGGIVDEDPLDQLRQVVELLGA